MGAYIEDPADVFDFADDWFELVGDSGPSSANATLEAQESTRVGYVPAHKMRSAMRFFLGYAQADASYPWRLRREQPHWDAELPWLFAHSVSFSPIVTEANSDNPNNSPYRNTPFAVEGNRYANYKWRICTVKYRAFRCLFLPDSSISTASDEYKRNVQTTCAARIELLSADGGGSTLKYAETGPSGPGISPLVPFPAPVGVLLPKASVTLEWLNVDRAYLSANEYVFYPEKLFARMGTVNNAEFMGFPAGTLLMQPPEFIENPWPVASDTSADVEYDVLRSVTVRFHFDYFDPEQGATSPLTRGHNTFPWRANGKFFLCTRDGSTSLDKAFLRYTDFSKLFTHVSAP